MFFKAIGGLAAANSSAQLLQLLAQPFLARIYSPAQFGILAEVVSISTILAVIGTFQLNHYLVLEKNDQARTELIQLGGTLALISAVTTLFILNVALASSTTLDLSRFAIASSSVLVLSYCYANILRGILTSESLFKTLAAYTLARGLLITVSQFTLAYLSVGNGLLIGMLIGEILAQILLLTTGKISAPFYPVFKDFFNRTATLIKKKPAFFVAGTLQELASSAVFVLPLILISQLYGKDSGGQFALAHRMTWAMILLVAQSISPVLFRHFASLRITDLQIHRLLDIKLVFALLALAGPTAFFISGHAFTFLFDQKWEEAARMSSWVSIWAVSFIVSLPFRVCCRVLARQPLQLSVDTLALCAILSIGYWQSSSATYFVAVASWIGVIQNISLMILVHREISKLKHKLTQE